MMQRLGDDAGRALLREHERITREVIARHGGAEIKTIGDAFMVSFASVAAAAHCAVDLQRAFHAPSGPSPEDSPVSDLPSPLVGEGPGVRDLRIRIGLNAGEPIAEEGDLFGSSVILASRIVAQANGGEILVSDTVRGLLAGKPFLFNDRGDTALRGFEDPVRLYELRWQPA
jgi:adenylate cyclase